MLTATRTAVAAAALLASALAPGIAQADSPHFITGPTATLDTTDGDLTVSFKEAGLGNTPVDYLLTAASENFTFRCFTKSGNKPQGAPNSVSFSNVVVKTTLVPRNGQITSPPAGPISLIPQQDGASCQGGGLVLFLIAVEYDGVTFEDVTNSIGPFSLGDFKASNLMIGPFPSK